MDPKCADMNRGRQVIQAQAMVAADGSVADVFVRLEGDFPPTPVPPAPVVIDQRSCVVRRRGWSECAWGSGCRFEMTTTCCTTCTARRRRTTASTWVSPAAGMSYEFTPRTPEVMLKLGCDVHRWMIAFVGVMSHPYFAVSDATGQFRIAHVPAGSYTIKTWHEQFGERTQTVAVKPGGMARRRFHVLGDRAGGQVGQIPISKRIADERQHSAPEQHAEPRGDRHDADGLGGHWSVLACAEMHGSRADPHFEDRRVQSGQREAADLVPQCDVVGGIARGDRSGRQGRSRGSARNRRWRWA